MRRSLLVLVVMLLAACGDDSRVGAPPLVVGKPGVAVIKARRAADDHVLLLEAPTPLADVERPDRALRRFRAGGAVIDYAAAPGAVIADFAAHPGGAVSVLLVGDAGYAIERWQPDGAQSGSVAIADIVPSRWSRDAGRIAALGDDAIVALRAGDSSVRAQRYMPDGAGYRRSWDAMVEPGNDLLPSGLISGSYDTFGQLRDPFHVYLDIASDGGVWIAVAVDPASDLLAAHDAAFGEQLGFLGDHPSADALVTRLAAGGGRAFSRMVGTPSRDEVHGLRAVGDRVLVVGRAETHPGDPGGWDGLLAQVDAAGNASARTLDVAAGDILFDADVVSAGRTVAVGGTGYTDNPSGASISEACALLALVVTEQGQATLALPSLPRNNHLRTLLVDGASLWVAGMTDGPGTHSGDGDPAAIRADPFVAALALP